MALFPPFAPGCPHPLRYVRLYDVSACCGAGRPNGRRSDNAASSASAYAPGEEPSFWHTLWYMLRDMALVAVGPERRALFIAIGLAFFDQVRSY